MNIDILNGCVGLEYAIPAMRNSWKQYAYKSDSGYVEIPVPEGIDIPEGAGSRSKIYYVGDADMKLVHSLVKAGPSHRKLLRMIFCYMDVIAPLYWWKQFDTHRFGVEKISESTMHSILVDPFDIGDFEPLEFEFENEEQKYKVDPDRATYDLMEIISKLNHYRLQAIDDIKNKAMHERIIYSLLPDSYLQRRTVCMSYEAMYAMWLVRKSHKLPQWVKFCNALENIHEFKELCLSDPSSKAEEE